MEKNCFFTPVKIEKSDWSIVHNDRILLIGSCFTDEIGTKFQINGFDILKNPFGTIYNPISIANLLERVANKELFEEKDIIKSGEYYYLFATHGDIRGKTIEECLNLANNTINEVNVYLKQTAIITITLGTAWSYWYKEGNILMANCHKIPQKFIDRKLLTVEQIRYSLENMIKTVKKTYSSIKFLFTLSPVRHIKEGFYDNKLSKSTLSLAIDKIIRQKDLSAYYFPSYEIVMDELRDYRFYAKDMIHINEIAVDYIWQRLSETYFEDNTIAINEKYLKLHLMLSHRPINPLSDGYKKHLQKINCLEQELQ